MILFLSLATAPVFAEAFFSDSNATGFFVSGNGHLVTAYHAVENRKVSVVLADGRAVPAEIVRHNKEADLALLKIPEKTHFLSIALPDNIQVGMEIMTIGYPMISVQGTSVKVSRGIINSLVGFHEDRDSFQFDAATARGNSGGPVIGPEGLVVGVVNGKLHTTKVLERTKEWVVNVNYATNAATLIKFLGGVNGLASTRQLHADASFNVRKLFSETQAAIVPVVSDMSAMQSPQTKPSE
jgi:S1-C subfamily serine protease